MKRVVYPGTFDPISYGHIDLVRRALGLFDEVVIVISTGDGEKIYSVNRSAYKSPKKFLPNTHKLMLLHLTDYWWIFFDRIAADAVIRGLRAVSDFEYEFQMASINYRLNKKVETIFLTPDEKYTCLSSTMIREVARIDPAQAAQFVAPVVLKALEKKASVNK